MKIKDKYSFSLAVITLVGLLLRVLMAHIDPFLHDWDERYHALVAKNMIDNPFVPMLRKDALLKVDPFSWTNGTLWIHKQPLFLWQMAVSMKIFGINEYAVRYPSILMGTAMIPMLYYISVSFVQNKSIALIAAALLCLSNFHLELISGIKGMDHNDVALGFYVLASVFAWIKYKQKKGWKWILLTGIFAGCAILNKWLIGLYVFLVWGLDIIINWNKEAKNNQIIHFLIALATCCLIFLPWQIYILGKFPAQAKFEYGFNRRHITEALEGHTGSVWYYLGHFAQFFGEGVWLLILPGFWLFFRLPGSKGKLYIPLVGGMVFVFCFLSFFVETKVASHFYFVAPFFYTFIAISIYFILSGCKYKYLKISVCILIGVLLWKPEKTMLYILTNEGRKMKIAETASIKSLKNKLGDKPFCVIGTKNYIELMFYNNNISAFETIPSQSELDRLAKKGVQILAFSTDNIPDYIKNYAFFLYTPQNNILWNNL